MNSTQIASQTTATATAAGRARVAGRASLAAAFALGASLVFLVGFAHIPAVHNAAHDTRHTMNFPCH